jgi:hypothetical protein
MAQDSCTSADGYGPLTPLETPIHFNLLRQFQPGTDVKICVVGSAGTVQQDFESYTNLFWKVGRDVQKDYNFEGQAWLEDCSASLVRFDDSRPGEKALAMTNAHCLGLEAGSTQENLAYEVTVSPLMKDGKNSAKTLQATRIIYATLGVTDLALLELDKTYAELPNQKFLTLARETPVEKQEIDVITGLYSEGYSCTVDHIATGLKEGAASFIQALRYGPECQLYHGTSGSPVIDHASGKVVAINATGNDQGEQCTENNPCEVNEFGQVVTYKQGYGYALQTSLIYDCLTGNHQFDLNLPGCWLPKP